MAASEKGCPITFKGSSQTLIMFKDLFLRLLVLKKPIRKVNVYFFGCYGEQFVMSMSFQNLYCQGIGLKAVNAAEVIQFMKQVLQNFQLSR